ncbi:MAG: toxic anion resistance protein [Clostridia bacterium]|nr:toxic anion resistance protein [Clostridia bacterium]
MEVVNTENLKKEIEAEVKPVDKEVELINQQAQENTNEIMALDLENVAEKRQMLKSIDEFAMETMENSSRKNSLLQTTIGNLSKEGEDGSLVSNSLADLHREIKDLDPSLVNFAEGTFLQKIINPIRRYFEKYEKADGVINDILVSLDKGKNTLKNDNTTLDIEEENLRELTKKLNNELALGMAMDEQIVEQIEQAKLNGEDEEKIKFVTEEILFPLRQRIMDMQQMVVVNHQGIVAMEVIKRNNRELIRGVDRAKTVTVTALRTAVMVASALYNQKIVLKKIDALNQTTSNIIASTGRMLKEQGAEVQKQATSATVNPEALKQAFQDAISALEDISTFKQEALPKMHETIEQFRELAETGEKEILRLEKAQEEQKRLTE